jgi:signal transduction histidine kinase
MKLSRFFALGMCWLALAQMAAAQSYQFKLSELAESQNLRRFTWVTVDSFGQVHPAPPLPTVERLDTFMARRPPREALVHSYRLYFGLQNDTPQPDTAFLHLGSHEWASVQGPVGARGAPMRVRRRFGPFREVELFALPLAPGDRADFVVTVRPLKLYTLSLRPILLRKEFVTHYFNNEILEDGAFLPYLLVFIGMLFMMLCYVLAKAIQVKSLAYAYYAGYVACFLGYFTFKAFGLASVPLYQNPLFYSYLNNMLPVAAYAFYFPFVRNILELPKTSPLLNKYFIFSTYFQFFYAATDLGLILTGDGHFPQRWLIWDLTRLALIIMTVFSSIVVLRLKSKVGHYVVAGAGAIALFGLVALLTSNNQALIQGLPSPLDVPLFYFLVGIAVELVCFSFAIAYKNRLDIAEKVLAQENLKFEQEREAFALYKAVAEGKESERRRISREMHDDIGSGLTSILFLSNMLASQATGPKVAGTTGRISALATDLVDKMNDIIWSMNPQNDTLDNLVAYIRQQAATQLENAEIRYQFDIAPEVPALPITGEKRRNIYLTVKEAVNNVIKHARASEVAISIQLNGQLEIAIRDNGQGLGNGPGRKFGNGLRNMEQRMADIGGTFSLHSNGGTTVRLTAPTN